MSSGNTTNPLKGAFALNGVIVGGECIISGTTQGVSNPTQAQWLNGTSQLNCTISGTVSPVFSGSSIGQLFTQLPFQKTTTGQYDINFKGGFAAMLGAQFSVGTTVADPQWQVNLNYASGTLQGSGSNFSATGLTGGVDKVSILVLSNSGGTWSPADPKGTIRIQCSFFMKDSGV